MEFHCANGTSINADFCKIAKTPYTKDWTLTGELVAQGYTFMEWLLTENPSNPGMSISFRNGIQKYILERATLNVEASIKELKL